MTEDEIQEISRGILADMGIDETQFLEEYEENCKRMEVGLTEKGKK